MSLAIAGLGLAAVPTADAEIVFTVDETVVSGTALACATPGVTCVFQADLLNGNYAEVLTVNADFTFDVSARAFFTNYVLDGVSIGTDLNGTPEPFGGYNAYALFQASGSVNPLTGEINFVAAGASVDLYLDQDQDNTYTAPATGTGAWTVNDATPVDNELVASSTTLVKGTGQLTPPVGGFFDLVFGDLTLSPFGQLYWPTLATLDFFFATVDGDFNAVPSPPAPGTYNVQGDLSLVFVPEPTSLLLFGMGLLGSAVALRRRTSRV